MTERRSDGSVGDADYGRIGVAYSVYRRPDPRIARVIAAALGSAHSVLNVGAGAGSYEPVDREVTAVEPSASMRAQRPPELSQAIDATADALPFADQRFDAAMTTFSVHQWRDPIAGLREMRRVTRGPIVVLTCDPDRVTRFWLNEYAPDVLGTEARRYPTLATLAAGLSSARSGSAVSVASVPIPLDCADGFNEAYYGRPELLLDPLARQACSAWSFVDERVVAASIARLTADLREGSWDARYGQLRTQPYFDGSLVLVTAGPA